MHMKVITAVCVLLAAVGVTVADGSGAGPHLDYTPGAAPVFAVFVKGVTISNTDSKKLSNRFTRIVNGWNEMSDAYNALLDAYNAVMDINCNKKTSGQETVCEKAIRDKDCAAKSAPSYAKFRTKCESSLSSNSGGSSAALQACQSKLNDCTNNLGNVKLLSCSAKSRNPSMQTQCEKAQVQDSSAAQSSLDSCLSDKASILNATCASKFPGKGGWQTACEKKLKNTKWADKAKPGASAADFTQSEKDMNATLGTWQKKSDDCTSAKNGLKSQVDSLKSDKLTCENERKSLSSGKDECEGEKESLSTDLETCNVEKGDWEAKFNDCKNNATSLQDAVSNFQQVNVRRLLKKPM